MEEQGKESGLLPLLQQLYAAADLGNGATYACREGCADCCTQDVTMTALEGELILHGLARGGQEMPIMPEARQRPRLTTNNYVRQFLAQSADEEIPDDAGWTDGRCPFLQEERCAIYAFRPYMCRGFVSETSCRENGYAVLAPHLLFFNTAMMQLLEHLSVGRPWGLMSDVLQVLAAGEASRAAALLPVCAPIPGFIVAPEERQPVAGPMRHIRQVLLHNQGLGKHVREAAASLAAITEEQ